MKFALFILASWTEKDTSAQGRIYAEALEQIEYAEELGFDSVWIAEHHSSRYGICPSLMPMVTYVAARTKRIRIGTGVSVLPFHNPILLAEESAMMDVLSDGRLEFGVGPGLGGLRVRQLQDRLRLPGRPAFRRRWTSSWACGPPRGSRTTASSTRWTV